MKRKLESLERRLKKVRKERAKIWCVVQDEGGWRLGDKVMSDEEFENWRKELSKDLFTEHVVVKVVFVGGEESKEE